MDPSFQWQLPLPACTVHVPGVPVAVQKYRFCPAVTSVAKYISPRVQPAGLAARVPVLTGAVLPAAVKSTAESGPEADNLPRTDRCPFTTPWALARLASANTANTSRYYLHVHGLTINSSLVSKHPTRPFQDRGAQ